MGWCSGTEYFDVAIEALLSDKPLKDKIKKLIEVFEDGDWDCQGESEYINHPEVLAAFKELHPTWFEDEVVI